MPHQVLNYPQPRRPSELCSITFLRYAMFSFTSLLLISSLVMLGFGVWILLEKMQAALVLPVLYRISVYGLVVTGAIVFFTSIVGCYGTIQEQYGSLVTFSVFLVLIFLAEVGVGVVSYILYTQVTEAPIADHIDNVFISQWGSDPAVTRAINNIQMEYHCCGSESYSDWLSNSEIGALGSKVPDSCCITPANGCGGSDHPSNIHRTGCSSHISRDVWFSVRIVPAITLGLSIMQIIGVIFSCALAHQISRSKKFVRRKYVY